MKYPVVHFLSESFALCPYNQNANKRAGNERLLGRCDRKLFPIPYAREQPRLNDRAVPRIAELVHLLEASKLRHWLLVDRVVAVERLDDDRDRGLESSDFRCKQCNYLVREANRVDRNLNSTKYARV